MWTQCDVQDTREWKSNLDLARSTFRNRVITLPMTRTMACSWSLVLTRPAIDLKCKGRGKSCVSGRICFPHVPQSHGRNYSHSHCYCMLPFSPLRLQVDTRKAPRARRALTLRGFLGFCEAERSMRARLPSLEAQILLHCRPSATAHPLARRLSRSACFRPEDYHMS